MLKDLNLTSAILVALLAVPVLLVAGMDPIVGWLRAREKRKKAAAAKSAAADGTAAGAAAPSTVAPSAPSSTPEPA
ncbi:MAG: hypothetical protein OXU71_10545 [Gammaproteobacteria bacterium]|nr:hypothetical protein [Gammaproteobacteria bacterium]